MGRLYDEEYHGTYSTEYERKDSYGRRQRCNRDDEGAYKVKRCNYCGRVMNNYICDCEESIWK